MIYTGDSKIVIEDDKCYCETPVCVAGYVEEKDGVCERRLVMTKEAFVKCYNAWIKEGK